MATITLTQGMVAHIDDNDLEAVALYTWCAQRGWHTYYAQANVYRPDGRRTAVQLHKLLVGGPLDCVDHIDGNGLNNRRANLRVCTRAENARNARTRQDNTSGYKGVYWQANKGLWVAKIRFEGVLRHLGYHEHKEDAALAYNVAAQELHGEFARLNQVCSRGK